MSAEQIAMKMLAQYFTFASGYAGIRKLIQVYDATVKRPSYEKDPMNAPMLIRDKIALTGLSIATGSVFFPFILLKDIETLELKVRGEYTRPKHSFAGDYMFE
jgi:hypothetical protein